MLDRIQRLWEQAQMTKTFKISERAKILTIGGIIFIIVWGILGFMSIANYRAYAEEDQQQANTKFLEARLRNVQKELDQYKIGGKGIQLKGKASFYDYNLKDSPSYSRFHATAASRDLPRGSKAKVCTIDKCIEIRINDFGPQKCPVNNPNCYLKDRVIDLSSFAFVQLAPLNQGIINVIVTQIN